MANNSVIIKSFRNGLDVFLDPDLDFELLKTEACRKFGDSAKFFGNATIAVSFSGRKLTSTEENELIEVICGACGINICCVIEKDEDRNEVYLKALEQFAEAASAAGGQLYKGSVKAGETVRTPYSIIVLGDVNPGAKVISGGNIVVLGTLYGFAHAGYYEEDAEETFDLVDSQGEAVPGFFDRQGTCFVAALEMKSPSIAIGGSRAHIEEKALKVPLLSKNSAKICYGLDKDIYIESISKEFLRNLPF